MRLNRYDILVVGAGPAGSSAAAEAARRGMRVLVVERRRTVGVPVQCAEFIPAQLVGALNLGKQFLVQRIRGMKTFLNERLVRESATPGFMIRRDLFDQILAEHARKYGAEIRLDTRAVSREGSDVTLKTRHGQTGVVRANLIIGADGPLSTVAKWAGCVNPNRMPAIQVSVPLPHRLDFTEVYFDRDIYAGYAWLFPKGDRANLGLGLKRRVSGPPPLGRMLARLIEQRCRDGRIVGAPSDRISGWIPFGPAPRMVHENIILTGDAAGHTHPITGAGIFPAVTCGAMAGKWAARAVAAEDLSLLSRYEADYRDLFGDSMERAISRRHLMEEKWDQLEDIFPTCWVAFKEYYGRTR